jgi:hypothetical protein
MTERVLELARREGVLRIRDVIAEGFIQNTCVG